MGQSIRIAIQQEENAREAVIYYHSGGYSIYALELTRNILRCIQDTDNPIKDIKLRLIRFVESEGGCIDGGKKSEEFKRVQNMYPDEKFNSDGDRDCGLIAVSDIGMDEMDAQSPEITIDLSSGLIFNRAFWIDTESQFKKHHKNTDTTQLKEISIDINEVPFEDIERLMDELIALKGEIFRKDKYIYSLIA